MGLFLYDKAMRGCIIFLTILAFQSKCTIKLVHTYYPYDGTKPSNYWSWTSSYSHSAIIVTDGKKFNGIILKYSQSLGTLSVTNKTYGIDFNSTSTVKTVLDSSTHLVYNDITIKKYDKNIAGGKGVYTVEKGLTIVSSLFGANYS